MFPFLLLLAGCADGVTVSHTHYTQYGIPSQVDLAAAQGPLPVALRHSPFAAADVLAALRIHNPRPSLSYTTNGSSGPYPYRLVLGFGTRPPGGSANCTVLDRPAGPSPAGTTALYGAFCLGDTLLSEASAQAPAVRSAGDPAFARLAGDLLAALLPARDPLADPPDRCRRWPVC